MEKKILILIVIIFVMIIVDDIAYKSPYEIRKEECNDYSTKADEEFYKYKEVEWKEGGEEFLANSMKYNQKAIDCLYSLYPMAAYWGVWNHIIPFKWTFMKITTGLNLASNEGT